MRVRCIILNYRTAEMTARAVRAAREALSLIPEHHIDVVDNDSRDGSFESLCACRELEGWDDVDLLQSRRNGGFAAGNNLAIARALQSADPPDYFHLVNSDAFLDRHAVTALLDVMDARPEVGIAGSALRGSDGEAHVSAFRFPSIAGELLASVRLGVLSRALSGREIAIQPRPEHSGPVDWLAGASIVLRRETLEDIGLFDENYFLYYEETDLCLRARKAGWHVWYVVESHAEHVRHASTGLGSGAPQPRYWFDSRRHYYLKNHGRLYALVTNVVQAAGLASFQTRAWLQRKDRSGPPRFLRDFMVYNFVANPP